MIIIILIKLISGCRLPVSLGIAPGGAGFFILSFWGIAAMSKQIEIYENDLLFYLNEFCEVNAIEDMKKESQSVWNSALYYIQKSYLIVIILNPKITITLIIKYLKRVIIIVMILI